MKCEFGYCLVCEREIARRCGECGTRKPSDDYTEVQLTWSNGSRMNTAVCVDCAVSGRAHQADKKQMTEAIWRAWDRQGAVYDKGAVLV